MQNDPTPMSRDMLLKMVTDTRQVVEQRKKEVPLAGMFALASMQRGTFDLKSALMANSNVSLIAQIKRSAPDMQTSIQNFDPVVLAKKFESAASALAVATNEKYYHGGIADLTLVAQNVEIPVIRQDFVYDEYQIVEARAAGADAVLLMAALLPSGHLRDLISITQRNRMTEVVQVQSKAEVQQAVEFEPRVVAISNRDMHTFQVDLDRTLYLREYIPPHMAVISMGGLRTPEDIAYVHQASIDAVVVGQALLMAPDARQAISELFKLTEST